MLCEGQVFCMFMGYVVDVILCKHMQMYSFVLFEGNMTQWLTDCQLSCHPASPGKAKPGSRKTLDRFHVHHFDYGPCEWLVADRLDQSVAAIPISCLWWDPNALLQPVLFAWMAHGFGSLKRRIYACCRRMASLLLADVAEACWLSALLLLP